MVELSLTQQLLRGKRQDGSRLQAYNVSKTGINFLTRNVAAALYPREVIDDS